MGNACSTSRYQAPYNSLDGDLVLRSSDGYRFRVNSFALKTASGYFRKMDVVDAPVPASKAPPEIPCDERRLVLKCMLDAIYPSQTISPRDLQNFEDFRDLCIALSFKYDIKAGPTIVQKLLKDPSLHFSPILRFDLARRLGLEEEARVASSATLDLDLRTAESQACLRRVQTSTALDIINFHAERRNAIVDALPKAEEISHDHSSSPESEVMMFAYLSQLKDAIVDELNLRPSGKGLRGVLGWTVFKVPKGKQWSWNGAKLTEDVITLRVCERLQSLPKEIVTSSPPPYSREREYGKGTEMKIACRVGISSDEGYNYPNADVELISSNGYVFEVHSEILRLGSTYFREKIVSQQHGAASTKALRSIKMEESNIVIQALLDTVYPDRTLDLAIFKSYDDFRRFIKLLDDKRFVESGRERAKSIFRDPAFPCSCILKYGLARELGKPWKKEADSACASTLWLNLCSPQSQEDLYQIPTGSALDLLNLHALRRRLVRRALVPPRWRDAWDFPIVWYSGFGFRPIPLDRTYTASSIDLFKAAWINFRNVVLQEIDNVPNGMALQTGEFANHPVCKNVIRFAQEIGMSQRRRGGLQEGLEGIMRSLPQVHRRYSFELVITVRAIVTRGRYFYASHAYYQDGSSSETL